jgi:branched-chain amino acid transport system substrate-binding protein
MTGYSADWGRDARNAIALAIDTFNAANVTLSMQAKLLTGDAPTNDPQHALTAAQSLVHQGASVIVGPINTSAVIAVKRFAAQEGLALFSPGASNALATRDAPFVVSTYPSDATQVQAMAEFTCSQRGYRRTALVYQADLISAAEVVAIFNKACVGFGGTIIASKAYQGDRRECAGAFAEAARSGAQAIYVIGDLPLELIANIGARAGFEGQILVSYLTSQGSSPLATKEAEGIITTTVEIDETTAGPQSRRFVTAYRQRYERPPTGMAYAAYDAANLALLAISRAGGNPAALRHYVEDLKEYDGVSGTLHWNTDRQCERELRIAAVRKGAFVPLVTWRPHPQATGSK